MPRSTLLRAAQLAAGLAAGLLLAEAAFWARDGGAFPHLNVYAADAELGARLRPGATQRVKYGANPATEVRIDADGWRGGGWGPPEPGEIVVVGDSQVFGLGVEEDEATPAQLAALRGAPVRNAGVPTYGPLEYQAVIERVLAERRPKTVVLVLNFSNDPFELARPNRERHVIWDGWAVRRETAPERITAFPGRSWLFNRSHAVYALRRWLHEPEPDALLPSEGTWAEVEAIAALSAAEPADPEAARAIAGEVADASAERREMERDLISALTRVDPDGVPDDADLAVQAHRSRASVGDIVGDGRGVEAGRFVEVTADFLREGAKLRQELEPRLRAWAEAHPDDPEAARIRELLKSEQDLDARLAALSSRVAGAIGARSPLAGAVEAARDACEAAGAELVVVALPLDVQVSETEWAKYGAAPRDMTATRALLADLVRDARAMGVRAVDPTEALAAAEPGAFLDGDLHLTPKGHAALAAAIDATLDEPAPWRLPGPGLPEGRSRVPTADEWQLAPENTVRGSSKNQCSTRELREWLRVTCTPSGGLSALYPIFRQEPGLDPVGVVVRSGPLEAMAHAEADIVDLVVPLLPGREVVADFVWADHTDTLTVRWEGDQPRMGFARARPVSAGPSEADRRLAKCLDGPQGRIGGDDDAFRRVQTRFGAPERCAEFTACADLVPCAQGARAPLPTCPDGEVNAGSAGFCYALCDAARPCAEGVCTSWQGAGVCL